MEKHKGFVYEKTSLVEGDSPRIEVIVKPRSNSKPVCDGCGKPGGTYDTQPQREFSFVPLWNIAVFLLYAPRRVNCRHCKRVVIERMPWAEGKCRLTNTYKLFLANWAKRLSWKETAEIFSTSWSSVYRSVKWCVRWGLVHRTLTNIESIGVDEIQYRRGHTYLTLVYQLDEGCKRLLHVAKDRWEKSLDSFFDILPDETTEGIKFACTDMWKAYLKVIKNRAPQSLNILDRFHIAKKMSEALDKVRADETRKLKADGYEPILKHTRWCLLKRKENLTSKQAATLRQLAKYNTDTFKAYLMKLDFDRFWQYKSKFYAEKFLRQWCARANRSKIEPMKKMARMLLEHQHLLLNWFETNGLSSGAVEGFNNKAKLTFKKAYGFSEFETAQVALYHQLARLPEPDVTHRFW